MFVCVCARAYVRRAVRESERVREKMAEKLRETKNMYEKETTRKL
jgi:hypothetical protein